MKTANLRLARSPGAPERLDDYPEYEREIELLRRLEAVQRRIDLQIRALGLRQSSQLGDDEGKNGPRRELLAHQLAGIEVELAVEPAVLESKIERALRIADGEELKEPLTPADALARLRLQEAALFVAVGEQREKVGEIRSRLSYEHAIATQPEHHQLLRAVYQAASTFAAAIDAERLFRADLLSRQFEHRPDQHPQPPLRAAAILGSELDPNSELVRWRRTLEDGGVL